MKASYRGYEIRAKRERCLAGYKLLYFTVERESDGLIVVDSFTEGSDTPAEMVGYLKGRIDAELAGADPWGERADMEGVHLAD
jgi:hypothetical protein